MKKIGSMRLALLAVSAVLVGAFLLHQDEHQAGHATAERARPTASRLSVPSLEQTAPVSERSSSRSTNRSPSGRPESSESTLPRNASAHEVVGDAISCFNHIEALKTRFADSGGNVERTLNGLQEVLFEDDVRLAKLIDPRFTNLNAGTLFRSLKEAVANGELMSAASLPNLDERVEAETGFEKADSLDALREHYRVRLRSNNQGFGNVAAVVEEVIGTNRSLNSDLLKDAWSYAAASTMLQNRYEHARERFDFKLEEISAVQAKYPPETLEDMRKNAARVAQFFMRDIESLEEAYKAVFAWRFANVHHVDAEGLTSRLKSIELANPSPVDLSLP